ncbi:hypothetical protein BP00DRAFT_474788 [Aspergillus indologenus CBS 114.80]|uniref:LysM domain-containing protein n=1 Tax=Aspergillus indologenus CBS 114.80 TaxID=1450541 RepID=A0A2V5IHE1_9EURO|nr:hypothetical protein BP00DRAFT_474788 [Aspergillus indologenus CBS 114.80]
MAASRMVLTTVLAAFLPLSWAQQFAGTMMFTNYTGLSTQCQHALATNVTCSPYLGIISESNGVMSTEQVDEVCVDSCYTSLEAARTTIAAACALGTDVIVVETVAYPATFIVDNYIFTYEIGFYTVQEDDDCNSAALALNVSTYSLLYTNNLDLYCQNWVTAAVNSTLCVPPQCETSVWQMQDSCNSVVNGLVNVTVPQFLSWNPNFDSLCQNAVNYIGYVVCIGPPGGYLNHTLEGSGNSTAANPTTITTTAPAPTNALNGSSTSCGKWYTVVEGDTCSLVSVANSVSLTDFYFLNPEIDANCTNLELGEAYCIAAVGDISTYSGYPITTPWITVATASFPAVDTSIPTTTSDPGFIYTPTYLPNAPGTTTGCASYRNYDDTTYNLNSCKYIAFAYGVTIDDLLAWNPSLDTNVTTCALQPGYSYLTGGVDSDSFCLPVNATDATTVSNCNCFTEILGYMAGGTISATKLTTWNPWLAGDCDAALYANITGNDRRSVCVGVDDSATSTTTTAAATTATPAAPTQTGVVAGCQEFFTIESGDDCSTMEAEFGVTLAQLYAWNPSIGPTCTNLWLGYAYCVKGPATTATATSVGPTQTGIAVNCDRYHTVVNGDSCAAIESEYSITFAQLYGWNPAIGSDCETLQIGYAVCVGVSS